jgi:hypothetical protein
MNSTNTRPRRSDDSVGSCNTVHREPRSAGARYFEQSGESCVQCLQPRDPVGNVGAPFLDQAGQGGGRVHAMPRVAPTRDPGSILEWQIEAAQVDDQAQVLDVSLAVFAIRVSPPTRRGEPTRALVEANRVRRDADRIGQFADPHAGKPWSGSMSRAWRTSVNSYMLPSLSLNQAAFAIGGQSIDHLDLAEVCSSTSPTRVVRPSPTRCPTAHPAMVFWAVG